MKEGTITEDYVSFEVAKMLKEKGFDIPCDNCYDSSGKTPNESVYGGANIKTLDYNADPFVKSGFPKFKTFSAPTLQMAMKWLREVHMLHIWIGHAAGKGLSWYYEIHGISDGKVKHIGGIQCGSYEVACESAIKFCLKNII